jgi:hypothetical protein
MELTVDVGMNFGDCCMQIEQSEGGAAMDSSPDTGALHEAIRRRAEEIYIRNGKVPGRDLENWQQAEREVQSEGAGQRASRTAIVVDFEGVRYVGEYSAETSDGYSPGEFGVGAQISVRFEGDSMFVKRPNGKELRTVIVQKIG